MESSNTMPVTYSSQQLITSSTDEESNGDQRTQDDENSLKAQSHETTTTENTMSSIQAKDFFTVGVLCFINLINYMDRFTIAGVLTELQDEFQVDDSKAGLLQTAFILFYMIFAPVFGYLGDRYSRKLIMGFGIALWSTTTLFGSFMPSYGSFIFFRAMVGVGEASYSTIAPTIISDLFVNNMRSKFLAVFYFAIPVGSGLGYIVGSEMSNALHSWRWALRVTPVLGLIAVVLLYFCSEPRRGQSEASHTMQATSYTEDLQSLLKNKSFILSTAGFTCVAFVAGALAWWSPTYMYLGLKMHPDNAGVTLNDVSFIFGIVTMVSGLIGVPLGSYLSQRFIKRYPRCDPLICAAGLAISAPLMALAMLSATTSASLTYVLIFLAELSLNLNWAIVADILLYVVIPTRRSTAEAFQILISHAFGDAGSPYFIGLMSDFIQRSFRAANSLLVPNVGTDITNDALKNFTISERYLAEENDSIKFKALQYALFTTCFVEILGAIFFFLTAIYILRDKTNADKIIKDAQQLTVESDELHSSRPVFECD